MNIMQLVLENGGQAVIRQLAGKVGLSESQTSQVLAMVMPALGQGIKRNLNDPSQLNGFINALAGSKHQQVLEQPETLTQGETVEDGNAILGHLFGSKDVSRAVASQVAEKAGTDPGIIKQLLPLAATLAMGALGKETQKRGVVLQNDAQQVEVETTTLTSTVLDFLDMDDDGSVIDDVFNLARKFL